MTDSAWTTGAYLSPGEVLDADALLPRLVHEAGIDHVVLRTGFDPSRPDPRVGQAMRAIRGRGLGVCLLVGAWWGEGIEPGAAAMRPVADEVPVPTALGAHESRWPPHCPLGPWTDVIEQAACRLAVELEPDAICLTHARFHHAADLSGLFSVGLDEFVGRMQDVGLTEAGLVAAVRAFARYVSGTNHRTLAADAAGRGLTFWMDQCCGSDTFTRWFDVRCAIVAQAVARVAAAVRRAAAGRVRFGVNAINPVFADLAGQDYPSLMRFCDFLQPLLGYVRWHALQPLLAWSNWLERLNPGLDRQRAMRLLCDLLDLTPPPLSRDEPLHNQDEGPPAWREHFLQACRRRLCDRGLRDRKIEIVLRGDPTPHPARPAAQPWREAGFPMLLYQDAHHLLQTDGRSVAP